MTTLGTLKRGDTFSYCAEITDNGAPITGIAAYLRSQIRKEYKGLLLSELSVSETDTPGIYQFKHDGSTQEWPLGRMLVDFEYTIGGVTKSSDTLMLTVIEDITHD